MPGRKSGIHTPNPRNTDEFGIPVTHGTRNELDVATQYTFSPERVRLFKDGARQYTQYGSITGFTDAADTWQISPSASETWHIETAESITYVVNFVTQASFAFQVNQSLQSGDVVQVGPRTTDDGWYLEQRGSDHDDDEVDIIELAGGSTTTLLEDIQISRPITEWNRYECRFNWYGVGNQRWAQTYTRDGAQSNDEFAITSRDGTRGPEEGNLNLWYEVTAGANTTDLRFDVGSMGAIVLGSPLGLTRSKPQYVEVDLPATNDTWLPVYAVRIDPDQASVNARIRSIETLTYGNNAVCELVLASFDDDKTNIPDEDWQLPEYHHAANSVMQEAVAGADSTYNVADDAGTVKTLGSSDKFGGYTVASSVIEAGGNTLSQSETSTSREEVKKSVLGSDHLVFLARSPNAGGTLTFVWNAAQDW